MYKEVRGNAGPATGGTEVCGNCAERVETMEVRVEAGMGSILRRCLIPKIREALSGRGECGSNEDSSWETVIMGSSRTGASFLRLDAVERTLRAVVLWVRDCMRLSLPFLSDENLRSEDMRWFKDWSDQRDLRGVGASATAGYRLEAML